MPPMPTAWWLRPVSSAARVGEQSAVVWKRLNLQPAPASRSNGRRVGTEPPNALDGAEAGVVDAGSPARSGALAAAATARSAGRRVAGSLAS